MRKAALILACISQLSSISHASDGCPLSNPAYRDLRSAALAMEAKIVLPAGCEQVARQLTDATTLVSSSAQALSTLQPGQAAEGPQLADKATTGISQIGNVFQQYGTRNDACGRALVSMSDYILAFVDTVNAVTPLLLAFGGPSSITTAMGATVLGSAVKTFIVYYQGTRVDMSTSAARQAFVENACGYHRLNESLRSLLQMMRGEESDLDRRAAQLRGELETIEAVAPERPSIAERYVRLDQSLADDRAHFSELQAAFGRLQASPALACLLIRTQVEAAERDGTFPSGVFTRLDELVTLSEAEARLPTAHRNLLESAAVVNRAGRYDLPEAEAAVCAARARDWMALVAEALAATDRELSLPGRRDLSQTEAGKARADWEKRHGKKKSELTAVESRLKFIRSLARDGAEIELSELLDIRDKVRRELFGNARDRVFLWLAHKRRPAESWLIHKWRSAGVQLRDYRKMMPFFRRNWLDANETAFADARSRNFACSYAENAVLTWNTADRHTAAMRLFCTSFEQTINQATHPYVTRFCLGKFRRDGSRKRVGEVARREGQIDTLRPEIDRILGWMRDAKCAMPKPWEGMLN